MARKFEPDHGFLDVLDTEDKVYFLGMMSADGCNLSNRNECSINLNYKDVDVIEKMSNMLFGKMVARYYEISNNYSVGIGAGNTAKYYDLRFSSARLTERLAELGCVPQKTKHLKFPKEGLIPEELFHHYLRGFWDGDGHIGTYANGEAKLTSTKHFCEGLKQKLDKLLGINCQVTHDSRHNANWRYLRIAGRKQTKKFLEWMYKDATVYMERKYQKYLEVMKLSEEIEKPVIGQYDLKGNLIAMFRSKLEASNKTGITRNYIRECCEGKRDSAGGFVFKQYKKSISGIKTWDSREDERFGT